MGLADQRAATFEDTRLTGLPVRHARLVVPWDGMRLAYQRAETDAWMRSTTAAQVKPLVTFGPSRRRLGRLPSLAEYRRHTRAFRLRYPHVREYSPWNEPNLATRRRSNDPQRIAAFYRTLRTGCPTCTVLGADVVDSSTLDDWIRAYLRQFPSGRRPRIWGLHNYVDANSSSSWGTRTMLRLTRGQLWFTETGAVYRRGPASIPRADRRHSIRAGSRHAGRAMRRVFGLAAARPRVRRVYVYHWRADRKGLWDSGLLSSAGTPRASFEIFADAVRRAAPATPPGP